jgi:hypothetical protein
VIGGPTPGAHQGAGRYGAGLSAPCPILRRKPCTQRVACLEEGRRPSYVETEVKLPMAACHWPAKSGSSEAYQGRPLQRCGERTLRRTRDRGPGAVQCSAVQRGSVRAMGGWWLSYVVQDDYNMCVCVRVCVMVWLCERLLFSLPVKARNVAHACNGLRLHYMTHAPVAA